MTDAAAKYRTEVEDDLVFDVGLHRGEDSAYYLSKGFRVVAFEANPGLVRECRARFTDELRSGRMKIVEGAIDDQGRDSIRFFIHSELSVWGTTDEVWAERNSPRGGVSCAIDVPGIDFVQAIATYGVPHYMKIDIEGADRVCLESLRRFDHRPRYLSIESEKSDWEVLTAEFGLLGSLGYDRFAVCQQAGMENREIATQTRDGKLLRYRFEPHSSGPFGEDIPESWCDRDSAIARYREIFRGYRRFGDHSLMGRTRGGRVLRRTLSDLLGRPLPGWYDTHAALAPR